MKRNGIVLITLVFCLLGLNSAQAGPVFYFDINIVANATQLVNGNWLYEYALSQVTHPGTFRTMSHWWLELPEEKIQTLSNFYLSNPDTYFNENGGPDGIYTTLGNLFNSHHYGVKWNSDQFITYSFESTHGPVLNADGSINTSAYSWFSKDGTGYYDYGVTLGPNGGHEPRIPEPATLSLLGLGLLGLLGLKRKK